MENKIDLEKTTVNPLFDHVFENENNTVVRMSENEIVYRHPTESKRNGVGVIYTVEVVDNERHMHPMFDSDVVADFNAIDEDAFADEMMKKAYRAMDKYMETHPEGVPPLTSKGW